MAQLGEADAKSLSAEQLQQLQKQLSSELQQLSDAASSLQSGISRAHQSGTALESLHSTSAPSRALIPMTSSVYVTATVPDEDATSSVLVDIGTGYYVHTSTEGATAFCKRKINELKKNLDSLGEKLTSKRSELSTVEQELSRRQQPSQSSG
jgi:prefoldin alpha subunit